MNKIQFTVNHLRGNLVLDAGCGTGGYSIEAAKNGFKVVAVDLSHNQLIQCKKQFMLSNIDVPLVKASVTDLPFRDETFNSVLCCDVIEHVPGLNVLYSELYRVLLENGKLCVTTPNGYGLYGILYDGVLRNFSLMAHLSKTSQLLMKREIETEHVHRFTPNSLRMLAKSNCFSLITFKNLDFLSTLYHFIFHSVMRIDDHFVTLLKNADENKAMHLPLRLGSEWFFCMVKQEKLCLNSIT